MLQLYDLHVGEVGEQRNAEDGCAAEDSSCGVSVTRKPHGDCGVNGACIGNFHGDAQCVCKPGWRGLSCDIRKLYELPAVLLSSLFFLDRWRNEMPLQATCHDHCNSPLRSLTVFSLNDLYISVLQLSRASRCMVIDEGSSSRRVQSIEDA